MLVPGDDAALIMTEPDASGSPSVMRVVARGASWNVIGQLTPTVITIFLTPYILHGLGITRYGLFVLTGTLVGFLSAFDGGIRGTAQRYFGVYAGTEDTRRSTRLLVTLLLIISAFGLVLSISGWFLARPVVDVLNMPASLRPQALFLFRTLGLLIAFGFIHNIFVGLLQAHHRFAYITKAGFAIYGIWTVGLILTVHYNWGLRGIALVFVTQQVFLALVIMPASLGYARWADVGLLPKAEIRELMGFASRTQLSGFSILINTESDALLIGAVLSVRTVSFYNAGANFAENVAGLANNVIAPIQTALTNTFGPKGEAETFELYKRMERIWVIGITGWFAVMGGAAWFAITAWLGPRFGLGGEIAIIALLSQMFNLYSGVLRTYCAVIGKPGLVSRFGIFSVVVNLALTIPLVFAGPLGVVAATAAGQLFGAFYIIRRVKRTIAPELPNILGMIPFLPGLLSAGVVVGLELAMRPIVPGGGLGLLASGPPVLVGLAFFAAVVLGVRPTIDLLRALVARLRGRPFTLPHLGPLEPA